ncbi:branched-chain amino acid ABC transporter permease [Solirubrobacter soli]|uniref:branched-chain amino acid ABC transporter permease n=1 Tax=Solirubrobacter soli TaxID=363832 RepID=UPI000413E641|nr:branched-chain amino acid ABC transporter permease [Solirubrobacter soli]
MKRAVLALAAAAVLPLFLNPGGDTLNNLVLAAAYTVMALGLNVVVGFAGLLDLGYVAFFAIGAHVAAYFGSEFRGIHLNFLLIAALAIAITALAGVLIGLPTLRLRGDYIGIVTLAFGEIIGEIAANGRDIHLFGGTLTGGPNGMSAIDKIDLPFLGPFSALDLRPWYWFALGLVALTLVVNFRLRDSRLGRAWIAMRDDEAAAVCAGVPMVRTKLAAYGVGASLGGLSGAFFASYLGTVSPTQFTFSFSIFILAMVVLGGMGSIWGVVLGSIVLSAINTYLLPKVLYDLPSMVGFDFNLSLIASGIYGFLLVLMMLLRPQGIVPEVRRSGHDVHAHRARRLRLRRADLPRAAAGRGG